MRTGEAMLWITGWGLTSSVLIAWAVVASLHVERAEAENARLKKEGWQNAYTIDLSIQQFNRACISRHWW